MGKRKRLVLLTGATGYIGGRLLKELENRGHPVRCLARRPEHLISRVGPATQVVRGDVFDPASVREALDGVHTAYYLIHSLGGKGPFESDDRTAARNFGHAAREAGVKRIIYFGGLGKGLGLSKHLASRQEVGAILKGSGVPIVELRASIVIGSGSLSFEMVRALVEKLPVMVTPRWVRALAQPIAVEDAIAYLICALEIDVRGSAVYEIGGADRISYEGIMREYARQRGLKRLIIPIPVLPLWLSSLWLALVTPLYFRIGRWLIESVRNPTVVNDDAALRDFPVRPMGIRLAVERALKNEDKELAETRWSDALPSGGLEHRWGGVRFGPRLLDSREMRAPVAAPDLFRPIRCIGGAHGWYAYDWLWNLRGFIDKILGGVGAKRRPRDPHCLLPGETVGFWRVESMEPDRCLRLRAEMKLPGRAWLQFEVEPDSGGSVLRQTAIFDPIGLGGLLYWYALYPLHVRIFRRMIRAIIRAACQKPRPPATTSDMQRE